MSSINQPLKFSAEQDTGKIIKFEVVTESLDTIHIGYGFVQLSALYIKNDVNSLVVNSQHDFDCCKLTWSHFQVGVLRQN